MKTTYSIDTLIDIQRGLIEGQGKMEVPYGVMVACQDILHALEDVKKNGIPIPKLDDYK